MPRKKKEVKKQKPVEFSDYIVSLKLNGEEMVNTGNTITEALSKFRPSEYRSKGVLKVVKGDKEIQRVLFVPQMRRLFGDYGGLSKDVALAVTVKQLEHFL